MLLFKDNAKYFKINNTILFSTTMKSKIYNGAKLGDATVARAPPLLCPPQNFIA